MEGNNLPITDTSESNVLDLFDLLDANDIKTASLFLPAINFSKYGPFIINFLKTSQNNKDTRDLRWKINCVLAKYLNSQDQEKNDKFDFIFQPEIENEYIDDFFNSSKDQIVSFILPFLNNQKTPKTNEIHNLSFYTIVFSESYPGIFDCLYDTKFKHLLYDVITIPKLFEILSTDFLYILKDPPTEFLKTVAIDLSDAPMFFKSSLNYQYPDFTLMLQKRLSLESQYPGTFPQIYNGNFLSLLNTSFVTEESFFDITSNLVLEHLTIGEFDDIKNIDYSLFGQTDAIRIIPYILCAYQQPLYSDLRNAMTLIEHLITKSRQLKQGQISQVANSPLAPSTPSSSGSNLTSFVEGFKNSFQSKKSILSRSNSNLGLFDKANESIINDKNIEVMIDILQRFKNDQDLATYISVISKVETMVNDLTNMSIPKYLYEIISRKEIVSQWSTKSFYLINDQDRDIDFDFIRGFHIFNIFLYNYPVPQSKVGIMKNIYDFANEISSIMKEIKNYDVRKSICLDIFSILFLRAKGRFLVSINYVRAILSVLALHSDSTYITDALARVSKINTKVNNDFTSLFIRDPKDFFNAIENRKFQTAYIFSKSGIFGNLFILAYSMYLIASKMQIPITAAEFTDHLNFEIGLSVNEEGFLLNNHHNKSRIKDKILTHLSGNSESIVPEIPTVHFDVRTELEDVIEQFSQKYDIPSEKIKEMLDERGNVNCLQNIELNVADDRTKEKIENGLANEETWKTLSNYARSFNSSTINGAKVSDCFHKAKHLLDFILYMNKYYNFCMLQPQVNPDSIFDEFNIFIPLTSIVNSGNIEKAEEFCSFLKIDLFKVVIENLDKFFISQTFLDYYEEQYPLEIKAIKMENSIEDNKNVNEYLLEDENFSENQIIYKIIDKIKLNEKVDYDEIGFYKIDHHILYKLIITNNIEIFERYDKNNRYSNYYKSTSFPSNKDFNTEMISLLKMIDYIAPADDLPMLEAIYFDHMKKLNELKDDKAIVEFYLNKKQYNDALNYVRSINNLNDELFELLLIVHDDLDFIDHLFFFFPKKFVPLAKHFSHYEECFEVIQKYSPKDKKKEVEGFINLPFKIRENSQIFDIESIISAFKSHPNETFNIRTHNCYLINDDVKLSIIDTFTEDVKINFEFDIIQLNKYVNFLFPLFETHSDLIKKWTKIIMTWINSIVVRSPSDEEKAIRGMTSTSFLISEQETVRKLFDNEFLTEIQVIHDFLFLHLNRRFSLEYNFEAFGVNNNLFFSDYILSFVYKYDLFQIEGLINDAFNADIENLIVHRVKSQIQLGLIQEARRTIQHYNLILKDMKKKKKKLDFDIKSTEEKRDRTQMKDYLLNENAKTTNTIKKHRSCSISEITEKYSEKADIENSEEDDHFLFVDNFHDFMKSSYRFNDDGSNLFLHINLEHPFYSVFMHTSAFDTDFILSSFYPEDVNSASSSQNNNEYSQVDENVVLTTEKVDSYSKLNYNYIEYVKRVINSKKSRERVKKDTNHDMSALLKFQLRFYATAFSTIPSALLILNSTGNFGTAYQVLMSIQDQLKRHNYFVLHFYPATFFYSFRPLSEPMRTRSLNQARIRSAASESNIQLKAPTNNNNNNNNTQQTSKAQQSTQQKVNVQQAPSSTSPRKGNSSDKSVTFSPIQETQQNMNAKQQSTNARQQNMNARKRPRNDAATQDPTRILTFLKSQDTESILTPGLIASLIFFLEEKHMYSLLTSLSFFANRLEDSAIAAIHAFAGNTNNWHYIDHAIKCLSQTLLMRQNKAPIPTNPDGTVQLSVFSRDETLQSITLLKEKVVLQKEILNFFSEMKGLFDEKYDILNNEEATMNCSTFLLLNFNFSVFQKIRKLMANDFRPKSLIKLLAVQLSRKDSTSIDQFFDFYEVKYRHLKDSLLPCLLRELSTNKNWQNILRLILLVPSPMERLYYFIEFDFIYEALGIILSPDQNKEMLSFLPYIAHRVASIGNTELFANVSGLI